MKLPKISLSKKIIFLAFIFLFLFAGTRRVSAYVPESFSDQFSTGLTSPSWEKGSFDFTTFNNILESVSTSILGSGDSSVDTAMGGGFIGKTGNLITAMYVNPPASSKEYLADLGSRLKIIKPSYAQGIGFEGLKPILPLWTIFRNLAYVFFTIIFILTGFAIMFRLKINPQTVVTIQNALPKIIISLILVTFSYAIAGLLIDFIYVSISLIFASLSNLSDFSNTMGKNIFGLAGDMFVSWETAKSVFDSINTFTGDLFKNFAGAKTFLGIVVGGLGTAIIAVAIAFSVFKIFFTLLISYISIIAGVIFSPIMLMLEAVPGQKGLNNWLKLMISNIIVFPLVAAIFTIGGLLTETVGDGGDLWVAPFVGMSSTEAAIPVLIGVAIIIAAPTVISTVQKSIGAPGMAGMAAGIVAPLAAAGKFAATPITYPVGQAKAGMEKYHQGQVGEAYGQGGIRSAAAQSFFPWRKSSGSTGGNTGGGGTQAPPGSPSSA